MLKRCMLLLKTNRKVKWKYNEQVYLTNTRNDLMAMTDKS